MSAVPREGNISRRSFEITPELMLRAYRAGLFPMAETRRSERLYWLDPEQRGVMLPESFHISRRLLRTTLSGRYAVAVDVDFPATIRACAAARPGREETWINAEIERLFTQLHAQGHAHSVETRLDDVLVGGLYGVAIGGVFFGESMFSTATDASKVALTHLLARLRMGGFQLLDTQFVTIHLTQFGAREIPRDAYKALLARAISVTATWLANPEPEALLDAMRGLAT